MTLVTELSLKCIEELKATKSNIESQIDAEEAEKNRLQREVERMSSKISQLNESLGKMSAARLDYERTIQESESAYMKILESSQLLLNMVKRESACLDQTLNSSSSERSMDSGPRRGHSKERGECRDDCHKTGESVRRKRVNDNPLVKI